MISCSRCGGEGHNVRTCPKAPTAGAPQKPTKQPRAPKSSAPVADSVPALGSVAEHLTARLNKLRREVETIERILADLKSLEVES